jgi:hypothetical protein
MTLGFFFLGTKMSITKKHLNDVCYIQGAHLCCRYLDEDTDDKGNVVHVCKKLSPDKSIIDSEVIDFVNSMNKSGHDPLNQGVPMGDNCPGYIVLKTKPQGYDVK